jgi:hypothetical protein
MRTLIIVFSWIIISISTFGQCDTVVSKRDSAFQAFWVAYWAPSFKPTELEPWQKDSIARLLYHAGISRRSYYEYNGLKLCSPSIVNSVLSNNHSTTLGGAIFFNHAEDSSRLLFDIVIGEGKSLAYYLPDIWEIVASDCSIPIRNLDGKIVSSSVYLSKPGYYKSLLFPGDVVNWPARNVTDKNGHEVNFQKRLRATERANQSKH